MTAVHYLALLFYGLDHNGTPVPCRGADAPLWTSKDRQDRAEAAERCRTRCFAHRPCADAAEEIAPTWGVWAGVDHGERPLTRQPDKGTIR